MSAKSLKLFGPPTTKWQPCKVFAKLNRNHLLMSNIFKLYEYQTFGLMKMHMCKIYLPIFSVCEKGWFTINGPSKILFFTFCLFPLPKFLKAIVKNLIMDFEGFLVVFITSQIFLIYTFLKMKRRSF